MSTLDNVQTWDQFCSENLLQHGLLSGVWLISSQGQLVFSKGDLDTIPEEDLAQFVSAFRYTSPSSEAQLYNRGFLISCGGTHKRFKIFQKTLESIYASAEGEEEHLIACRVAYGVLLCIHKQPRANAKVIDLVEDFCTKLRA